MNINAPKAHQMTNVAVLSSAGPIAAHDRGRDQAEEYGEHDKL